MKSMNLNQGIFELYSVLLGLNEKKKKNPTNKAVS